MQRARPILVTGSHRSGSTWVGKTLAFSPTVGYIREPFGVHHRPGVLDVQFPYWFPYICADNEGRYVRPIGDTLDFRYRIAAGLRAIRSPRDLGLVGHDLREFSRHRRRRARPLLKDPIALFSAEWLADRFDMDVVVLIRHPAAFASSLEKYDWAHPFDHFLRQPFLMRDLLEPYRAEIEDFARTQRPILEQAILLWNLIHHAILHYRDQRSAWQFFRHEDLSREPLEQFRSLFDRLGVPMSPEIERQIRAETAPSNPAEVNYAGALERDSRAGILTWKSRLSPEQIERVREGTRALAGEFYAPSDW